MEFLAAKYAPHCVFRRRKALLAAEPTLLGIVEALLDKIAGAIGEKGNPSFTTVVRLIQALGLALRSADRRC